MTHVQTLKYGVLVTAIAIAAAWYFDARNGWLGDQELRIELDTCRPDSVLNSWRARINPKGFWISQNVILESSAERSWWFQDGISNCGEISDQPEKVACINYFRNRFDSIKKCYRTTGQLCRAYRGYC